MTVLHEYGHAIHYALNEYEPFPYTGGKKTFYGIMQESVDPESVDPGGDLTLHSDRAFAEGWASFFAAKVIDDFFSTKKDVNGDPAKLPTKYKDVPLDDNRSAEHLDANNYWTGYDGHGKDYNTQVNDSKEGVADLPFDGINDNANSGDIVMGAVASVFWDLADAEDEYGFDDDGVKNKDRMTNLWNWFDAAANSGNVRGIWDWNPGDQTNPGAQTPEVAAIFIDHGIDITGDRFDLTIFDNDVEADAAWLVLGHYITGPRKVGGLILAEEDPDDGDWYKFRLRSYATSLPKYDMTVTLDFPARYGDLDLLVRGPDGFDVSRTSGFQRGPRGNGVGNWERVTFSGLENTREYEFIVGVAGYGIFSVEGGLMGNGGDYNPEYSLTISGPIPPTQKPEENQATGNVKAVGSQDPNDKVGPAGHGDAGYILPGTTMPYTVYYENDPDVGATAAAQVVLIEDPLDTDLDWTTFELGDVNPFGDFWIDVPQGLSHFETLVDLRPEGTDLLLQVTAGLNSETGMATWLFESLDPDTLAPPDDVMAGFLPVNDKDLHNGEGRVLYSIRPLVDLPSGSEIRNQAFNYFDENEAVPTPATLHTIDVGLPSSRVEPLPAQVPNQLFTVSWTGTDDAGGSGIRSYDVYVSDDMGQFTLWQDDTVETSATFDGQAGHTYRFHSIATDNVGHAEEAPVAADAQTTVSKDRVGTITFLEIPGLNPSAAEVWVHFQTSREGVFAIDASFTGASDSVALTLYDENLVELATSTPIDGGQRIDHQVQPDQEFSLKVTGTNADVDLRLSNLIAQVGTAVTVYGTAGDDVFEFDASASRLLTVNGVRYDFDAAQVETVTFDGGDGDDTVVLNDSIGNDTLIAEATHAVFSNSDQTPGFTVTMDGFEELQAYSKAGGNDSAVLHGSATHDKLKSYEDFVRLRAKNMDYSLRAKFFGSIVGDAGAGGKNTAVFNSSNGTNSFRFDGSINTAQMQSTGRNHKAVGFDRVIARAGDGTDDVAYFTDMPGDDRDVFYFRSHKTELVGSATKITARAFDEVHAEAGQGGFNVARIYDTPADEHFEFIGDTARVYRRIGTELDLLYEVVAFERVKAYRTLGNDTKDDASHAFGDELYLYGWDV